MPPKPKVTDKRKVTMRNTVALADGTTAEIVATDYVPAATRDAYVADARTRWSVVEVGTEPDAGPGGV